jgi:hypothetical protein
MVFPTPAIAPMTLPVLLTTIPSSSLPIGVTPSAPTPMKLFETAVGTLVPTLRPSVPLPEMTLPFGAFELPISPPLASHSMPAF